MLILTRRPREAVKIGKDIWVKVLEVRGNQVKIGFEAPSDVLIDRDEVAQIKEWRSRAAQDGQNPQQEPVQPAATLHLPGRRRGSNTPLEQET
jgi:carbon storage regulator